MKVCYTFIEKSVASRSATGSGPCNSRGRLQKGPARVIPLHLQLAGECLLACVASCGLSVADNPGPARTKFWHAEDAISR